MRIGISVDGTRFGGVKLGSSLRNDVLQGNQIQVARGEDLDEYLSAVKISAMMGAVVVCLKVVSEKLECNLQSDITENRS